MLLFTTDTAAEHGIKSERPLPALPERDRLPAEQTLPLCWKTPRLLVVFKASFFSKPGKGLKTSLALWFRSMQSE